MPTDNPCACRSCGSPWLDPQHGSLVCCDCGAPANPQIPAAVRDQLRSAYAAMTAAGIDPGMPTADAFADWFYTEEESHRFDVGCCDFNDRPALVYAVTALRFLCAVEHQAATELLGMALASIRNRRA